MSTQIKKKKPEEDKESLGITVGKKEDLPEWYTQVVLKAELADYTTAKGFIVLRARTVMKSGRRSRNFLTQL